MATCPISDLIDEACESGFKCLDQQTFQALFLQLLCNISANGGGESLPSGVIMMWSGSIATIPTGYVLCDGSNGTPDLRNRFVVAANADSAGTAMTTLTGAATQSGGSISHTHGIVDAGHTHSLATYTAAIAAAISNGDDQGENAAGTPINLFGENVAANIQPGATNLNTTGITAQSTSIAQPYYALAYIMKT